MIYLVIIGLFTMPSNLESLHCKKKGKCSKKSSQILPWLAASPLKIHQSEVITDKLVTSFSYKKIYKQLINWMGPVLRRCYRQPNEPWPRELQGFQWKQLFGQWCVCSPLFSHPGIILKHKSQSQNHQWASYLDVS